MNILVVEDDNIQRENLVKIIEKNFIDIRVYKAESYDKAIYYINNKDINLFFIDIKLKERSGIILAEKIRKIDRYKLTGIIFITAEFIHIAQAVRKAHCYDYIVKPYKAKQIINIINVFIDNSTLKYSSNDKYTFLGIGSNLEVKILNKNILFIKSMDKCCEVHTIDKVYRTKRISLKKCISLINDEHIMQTHKSFAININHIDKIEKSYDKLWLIKLKGTEEEVLLSKTYRDKLMERLV